MDANYNRRSILFGTRPWLVRALLLALLLILSLSAILLFTSLARGAAGQPSFTAAGPAVLTPTASASPPAPVVIEEPALAPAFTEQCSEYWYRFTNNRSKYAFLTLNVNLSKTSTNQGQWHPNLPQDGLYNVEGFVPSFPPTGTQDLCSFITDRDVVSYTSDARFSIQHGNGRSVVTVEQDSLSNGWISLGEFPFRAGTAGLVTLTDQTGDPHLTRGVIFSAMRFTWITTTTFTPQYVIHLPMVRNDVSPSVRLTNAWTAESGDKPMVAFVPGESMLLRGKGTSSFDFLSPADLTWQVASPCGPVYTFRSSSLVEPGEWNHSQPFTVPGDCTGVYSYTLTVATTEITTRQTAPFVVNLNSTVLIPNENQAAFDKCEIEPISKMKIWWDKSPYWVTNLYVGGVSRAYACPNTGLTAFWVSEVSKQGWRFIPTWVGPQAPCTTFRNRFSYDPAVAYQQGQSEADAAFKAVDALGLGGSTVIYYDIEATPGATTSCIKAIQSFLSGWTGRLHEYGSLSGAYGAPCSSVMSEWAKAAYPPDAVWIASWYPPPYAYDSNATVYDRINQTCLPNTLWANYQRIRQYNNTHTETWGGVAFTIDSNVSLGPMSFMPQASVAAALPDAGVQAAEMVAPDQGWAISDNRLLWTAGDTGWRDITPRDLASFIANVHFSDAAHGWLLSLDEAGQPRVYRTEDGGASWRASGLPNPLELPAGTAEFASAGPQDAWIALSLQSSSNFSLAAGFRSRDGGLTWEAVSLPAAGKLYFLDEQNGWLSGGPGSGPSGGTQLYVTRDGGQTWQPETLDLGEAGLPGKAFFSLPSFRTGLEGLLAVSHPDESGEVVSLYETHDGGLSWSPAAFPNRESSGSSSGPAGLSPLAGSDWPLDTPAAGELVRLTSKAAGALSLPEGTLQLGFAGEQAGWAIVQTGACTGNKLTPGAPAAVEADPFQCASARRLLQTADGGQSWVDVTPSDQ